MLEEKKEKKRKKKSSIEQIYSQRWFSEFHVTLNLLLYPLSFAKERNGPMTRDKLIESKRKPIRSVTRFSAVLALFWKTQVLSSEVKEPNSQLHQTA